MKRIILLVLTLVFIQSIKAETEKKLASEIKAVTVFLKGAQIERETSKWLEPGNYQMVVTGLSDQLVPSSIQVNGTGNFVIMSVNHRLNYLENVKESKQVEKLKDSLKILQRIREDENVQLQLLNEEESFLQTNKKIGGAQMGVKIEDLIAADNFFRKRMGEIKKGKLQTNRKIVAIDKDVQRINSQLQSLNAKRNKNVSEIVVNVHVKKSTTARLKVKYLVNNAGWIPNYDIRVKQLDKPLELSYKAKVYQNSGENWDNIKLTLSTANPQQSNIIPALPVWWLNYYRPNVNQGAYKSQYNYRNIAEDAGTDDMQASFDMPASGAYNYTTVVEGHTSTEFSIDLPYSIKSNGQFHDVAVQEHKLEATYQYYAAPKLDREAFLKARIAGWEQLNLLPGETNLYFEGTYVGKANIQTRMTEDTLDISLGRDKNIAITRVKRKEFCKKKFFGSQQKEMISWEINVRNKKRVPIEIVIEDHFPVSKVADIKVDVQETSKGDYNEETGKVKWKMNLQPSQSRKVILTYEVEFPKGKKVLLY